MPYPKGIRTEKVRAVWLSKRRERVQAFDQLVEQGVPRYKAAKALGSDVSSLEAMRRSIENLESGPLVGREGSSHIDLGLSLLACLRRPGENLTAHDIAAWCGCSRAAIQAIENRALRKLRVRLIEAAADQELVEELKETLTRRRQAV